MLDANTKYSSAWNEINARIQARDRVFLTFISLTAVLIGITLSNRELAFTAISVGYVALATSLLILQHDLIISHLANFQRDIVKQDKNKQIPDWMSEEYIKKRFSVHYIRTAAHCLFIIFLTFTSLSIASNSLSKPLDMLTIVWFGSALCSLLSVGVFICIPIKRWRIMHTLNKKQKIVN